MLLCFGVLAVIKNLPILFFPFVLNNLIYLSMVTWHRFRTIAFLVKSNEDGFFSLFSARYFLTYNHFADIVLGCFSFFFSNVHSHFFSFSFASPLSFWLNRYYYQISAKSEWIEMCTFVTNEYRIRFVADDDFRRWFVDDDDDVDKIARKIRQYLRRCVMYRRCKYKQLKDRRLRNR